MSCACHVCHVVWRGRSEWERGKEEEEGKGRGEGHTLFWVFGVLDLVEVLSDAVLCGGPLS